MPSPRASESSILRFGNRSAVKLSKPIYLRCVILLAEAEIAKHSDLDEDYFINAERVINIASRAREIFESSEVDEKRAFLTFLLQNPTADGEKLEFTLRSPFQELLSITDHPNELAV